MVARTLDRLPARVAWLAPGLAVGAIIVIFAGWFTIHATPGDAYNYLAAGERLNAGHPLYALSPGDRTVDIRPPYWTVPLLSPPFIAVLWRPLAALPAELGVALWWTLGLVTMAAALVAMAVRRPGLVGLATLALCVPVVYALGIGNVDAFLFAGAAGTWILWRSGRPEWAAVLVGVMIALKVTPAVFAVWLLAITPTRRVLTLGVTTVAACILVGILGAGLDATITYVGIARATEAAGASPLSLGGLTGWSLAPMAFALGGLAGVVALRHRPAPAFALAVLVWVFGSPTLYVDGLAMLLVALVPLCWPAGRMSLGRPAGSPLSARIG